MTEEQTEQVEEYVSETEIIDEMMEEEAGPSDQEQEIEPTVDYCLSSVAGMQPLLSPFRLSGRTSRPELLREKTFACLLPTIVYAVATAGLAHELPVETSDQD